MCSRIKISAHTLFIGKVSVKSPGYDINFTVGKEAPLPILRGNDLIIAQWDKSMPWARGENLKTKWTDCLRGVALATQFEEGISWFDIKPGYGILTVINPMTK